MFRYNSTFKVKESSLRRSGFARSTARLKAGKKSKAWIAVRRQLSVEFAAQGITSCELGYEGCWRDRALGYAHGRKRRNLKGDELKTLTILSCNPCHDKIEYLPPDEMLRIVVETIEKRKVGNATK